MDEPGPPDNLHRGWNPPTGHDSKQEKPIWLQNSLTDRKERFVPKSGIHSKKIVWYSCGPTVYDSAHMGHSRNYMTIDILRRVLEDYFGYSILFVMNITDVDDKIVNKARLNHLLKQYKEQISSLDQVREDTNAAVEASVSKQQASLDEVKEQRHSPANQLRALKEGTSPGEAGSSADLESQKKKLIKQIAALEEKAKGEEHKLNALLTIRNQLPTLYQKAQAEISTGGKSAGEAATAILEIAGDQIADQLDKRFGASVTDEAIFRKHAQRYETEFWQDMERLGVRKPTVLTRVTEYMSQIVAYIEQIIANGFAYSTQQTLENGSHHAQGNGSANGKLEEDHSVYFDTVKFSESGHMYPKLNPWAAGNLALASESEANFENKKKRNPKDFALWKASKPGQPSWPSPWGRGRPGWHIECSAMASNIIGDKVDIHTGGQDLRFPHHDNELAQAEAYYHGHAGCDHRQWVNYFLHSGHLSIDGLKMSKSLKNFISIREALEDFSASQLRLMFAMQAWNKEMTFGKTMKEEMAAKEHVFKHFFNNVDIQLRRQTRVLKYEDVEKSLESNIEEAKEMVDSSFRNNIDTAAALEALIKLIQSTNKYMAQREADSAAQPPGPSPHPYLLREAAGFVTRILRVLGISSAGVDDLGLGGLGLTATTEQILSVYEDFRGRVAGLASTANNTQIAAIAQQAAIAEDSNLRISSPAEILDALNAFRTEVRQQAKSHGLKPLLAESDRLRNETLVELGVRMEDKADGSSVWVAEDPKTLKAEAKAREAAAQKAQLLKKQKAIDDKKRTLEKAKTQSEMPTVQQALAGKYSRYSSEGQDANPTHDATGKELDKAELKKGKSAADKARKTRMYFDAQVKEKGPGFMEALKAEIAEAERALQQ